MHGMLVAELILTQERESTSFTESEGASEATEGEGRCQIYWGQHPVFAELHSTMVKPDRRATNGPQAHMPQTQPGEERGWAPGPQSVYYPTLGLFPMWEKLDSMQLIRSGTQSAEDPDLDR